MASLGLIPSADAEEIRAKARFSVPEIQEIEKRTIYSIFSKPVGRSEFIIGKYLGLCLTLLVNVLVMGIGVTLALVYVGLVGFVLDRIVAGIATIVSRGTAAN